MTRLLFATAFLLGATAVIWMGLDFAGAHTLAFIITTVIGGVYLIGIVELLQFRRATATLQRALNTIPARTADATQWLEQWLGRLDPSLQNAVRLRIEGERVGLPAPVFTPYLVGLLVMLGLLGTFVGMVDTLSGAVLALQGSTELEAIRAGLAAPIQGLSVAFGTSVAGVAASAMLGLISTLVRRDRMLATRQLEGKIATVFRDLSLAYNRQQAFDAVQAQAQALPALAETLQALATQIAQMGDKLGDTLLTNQQQFHDATEQRYAATAQMGDKLGDALLATQKQFHDTTEERYKALAGVGGKLGESLLANQQQFHDTTEKRYKEMAQMAGKASDALQASQTEFHNATEQHYTGLAASVDKSLQESLAASGQQAGASIKPVMAEAMTGITQLLADTNREMAETAQDQLRSFGEEFKHGTAELLQSLAASSTSWTEQTVLLQGDIKESMTDATQAMSASAQATSTGLLTEIGSLMQSTEALVQARIASETTWLAGQDERLEQLTAALTDQLSALRGQEEQGHAAAIARLAELESTVTTHLTRLGNGLEEPMTRLIETASETPRAAAEVIGQLRAEITNNVERDNKLLEERQRIMEQLHTLSASLVQASTSQREAVDDLVQSSAAMLQDVSAQFGDHILAENQRVMDELKALSGSVAQASTSQREAVDKLVESSTTVLQDVSSRFGDHIMAEVEKVAQASTSVAGGATELSSLGEAFSLAVDTFSTSNETMIEHLGKVEESMEKSSTRSDDQMAYYVAQAREIIDQSMQSQKEIIEDLRDLRRQEQILSTEAG